MAFIDGSEEEVHWTGLMTRRPMTGTVKSLCQHTDHSSLNTFYPDLWRIACEDDGQPIIRMQGHTLIYPYGDECENLFIRD
jgi:hypothetical protein